MRDHDVLSFLRQQIDRIPGKKRKGKSYINAVCPFHDDHNPSMGIRIIPPSKKLGSFKCLACGEAGDWNKLADRLNLERIKGQIVETEAWCDTAAFDSLVSVTSNTIKGMLRQQFVENYSPWPAADRWRGFSGKFLSKFEPYFCLRSNKESDYTTPFIWFPVRIDHQLVGGFLARLKKIENQTSYINANGEWSRSQGLWPYDYVAALNPKAVVLVEGPRDVLRLLRAGIPALCVFGTQSFSKSKANLIRALPGLERVFVFGDADDAGRKFNTLVKQTLSQNISVSAVILPESLEGEDPGSVPYKYIVRLRRLVRS